MKYAVLSDIHANLEALTRTLEVCQEAGVEKYICLGDVVGYNANPKECLDIVRQLPGLVIVKGNHDEYVSNNDDLMEGFNPNAKAAVRWTKTQLPPEDLEYLSNLPMKKVLPLHNITIVHATLDEPDAWGYIFDLFRAKDNFMEQTTLLCFCGHSHVPMAFSKSMGNIQEITDWSFAEGEDTSGFNVDEADCLELKLLPGYKYLINVGSIGQPRNRDPRASFAIYDSEQKTITRYRLPYDIAAAQEKIRAAGLPERNFTRLESGT